MTRQRANAIADLIDFLLFNLFRGIILITTIYGIYIAITSTPGSP